MFTAFIQGTNPVLPAIVIILIAAVAFFVSWWSYQQLTSIPFWKKVLLVVCRGGSLLLLVLLLLNPFLTREHIETEKPRIAVYLDNSQSIGVTRGEYRGLETYKTVIEEFNASRSEQFEYHFYRFDETVEQGDEITAEGSGTHLHSVIEHIREHDERTIAAVLMSDGIVTRGRSPEFAALMLSTPLFTVPVGDTTQVRDIVLADVDIHEPVYTNSRQTFRTEVQQEGFPNEETSVQLLIDGEVIETQSIFFTESVSSHEIEFSHEFAEPGIADIQVNIPVKPEEFTDQNNTISFPLEIQDDKTEVLSLAFGIHPDVSSVRRLIATDQQMELTSSTQISGTRFIGSDPQTLNLEFDLIVLHGLPETPSPLADWLEEQQVPVVYIATPGASPEQPGGNASHFNLIGFRAENLHTPVDVHIHQPAGELIPSHPLLEFDSVTFQRFPTLKTWQGEYRISSLAQTLLRAEFQRTATDIPLLVAEDTSDRRMVALNAIGWFRYEQSPQEDVQAFFKQFFTNILSWASTPHDHRTLVVEPRKSTFMENEPVGIRATLLNERGEAEPDGLIELQLFESNEEERRTFRMNHTENGVYTAELGRYPQGIYRVEANAVKDNRMLGAAETRVHVSPSSLEMVNTRRDDAMLQRLANHTGGVFLDNLQFERIAEFLTERNLHEAQEEISTETTFIHKTGWWFLIVVVLLSIEWILRRTVSLP